MSKKRSSDLRVFLAVVVMISISLACGQIAQYEEEISVGPMEELIESGESLSREEALEFFEDIEGERPYNVAETHDIAAGACDPGYSAGENVPVRLDHWHASHPADDVITITDENGSRDYTAFDPVEDSTSFLYCRDVEKPAQLECVKVMPWGFELFLYEGSYPDDNDLCYSAAYEPGTNSVVDNPVPDGEDEEPSATVTTTAEASHDEEQVEPSIISVNLSTFQMFQHNL